MVLYRKSQKRYKKFMKTKMHISISQDAMQNFRVLCSAVIKIPGGGGTMCPPLSLLSMKNPGKLDKLV